MTAFGTFHVGDWLKLLSDGLMVVLGVWVLLQRPRTRTTWSLGLFAVALGIGAAALTLKRGVEPTGALESLWQVVYESMRLLATVSLAFLALNFPAPVQRDERHLVGIAVGVSLAFHVALWFDDAFGAGPAHAGLVRDLEYRISLANLLLLYTALAAAALLAALRYPRLLAQRRLAGGSAALLGSALFIIPSAGYGFEFDFFLQRPLDAFGWVSSAAYLLFPLGMMGLWLANQRVPGGTRWAGRAAFWALAPFVLARIVIAVSTLSDNANLILALARLGVIGTLAFGVLRYRLFGLSVRVRRTFGRSMLAALFVSVFFVGSESAANFFGNTPLGTYGGILAAGLLVFVLAPLERVTQRLTERALPDLRSPAELDAVDKEYVYEEAARAAWGDGKLDAYERAMLDRLRASLGLDELVALRIERDAATH